MVQFLHRTRFGQEGQDFFWPNVYRYYLFFFIIIYLYQIVSLHKVIKSISNAKVIIDRPETNNWARPILNKDKDVRTPKREIITGKSKFCFFTL